jgi:hypothetical protein
MEIESLMRNDGLSHGLFYLKLDRNRDAIFGWRFGLRLMRVIMIVFFAPNAASREKPVHAKARSPYEQELK